MLLLWGFKITKNLMLDIKLKGMIIREARIDDIDHYMIVRMAVKENILSNPALVTQKDNEDYLTQFGKGWVCEIDQTIVGFAIVGLKQHNIWALFVHPDFEDQGIGTSRYHARMVFRSNSRSCLVRNLTQYKSRTIL